MSHRDFSELAPDPRGEGAGRDPSSRVPEVNPRASGDDGVAYEGERAGVSDAELSSLSQQGRFARVPYGAIRDKRLTFAYLRVLVALGERADNSGACYPLVRTIAEDSLCSERSVQRAVRVLERAGYLSTIRGGMVNGRRFATRYQLVYRPDNRPKRRASS